MAFRIGRERFEALALEALEGLPEEFRRLMGNVSVVVEDYPSKEDARETGVPRDELLGLFAGASYAGQDPFFDLPPPLPDRVVLYQRNLEAICSSEEELIEEIRLTLLHEVGHYFGLSEEELEEYE
ncbi:MAG: metallopeptidase family protein [Nitrospirota bacterium]|jgi:predicted Zn-dependent protease with MMP-like domain